MDSKVVVYSCGVCRVEYRVRMPERFYRWNGSEVAVQRAPAWCHRERCVAEAETLPTPAEVEETLALLEAESARVGPDPEIDVESWRLRRELMGRRSSPPRCLECGATDLDLLTDGVGRATDFVHPGCGGKLTLTDLRLEEGTVNARYYDPEGLAIEAP